MQFAGANPTAQPAGMGMLPGRSNYFRGNDPSQWRRDVPQFERVRYSQIYNGVDLIFYGNQQQLEYDLVVAPGANPNVVLLSFEGAESLRLDDHGDLVVQTAGEELIQHKPVVYQQASEPSGALRVLRGDYQLKGKNRVAFVVSDYDPRQPLVIDPTIIFSKTIGGKDEDRSFAVAVDSAGNSYITGLTFSLDFPTVNPLQAALARGYDAFVTKLSPTGAILYSTYLGGSGDDIGLGIAVDSAGNAYITGSTQSKNFPVANAFQSANAGGFTDAFITKLNPSGNALVFSSYLGGTDQEKGTSIAVDGSGAAYVTGYTQSSTFPTTAGAFQATFGGGTCFTNRPCSDAFVTKVSSSGSIVYSTFVGGSGNENLDYLAKSLGGIAVDSTGSAIITGTTNSPNFPTASPLQAKCNNCSDFSYDVFVTKLNAAGSGLVFSTYLGGSSNDVGRAIALDSSGNAHVTGSTESSDFPTVNAVQNSHGSGFNLDMFIAKLSAAGSALVYSTYFGGRGDDAGSAIAVDKSGNVAVAGLTNSSDFPVSNAVQTQGGGGLFKSANAGAAWTWANKGLPSEMNVIRVNPSNSSDLYAGGRGLFISSDGASTWKASTWTQSVYSLEISFSNPSVLFAGLFGEIYKSTDSGGNWASVKSEIGSVVSALAIDPRNASIIFAGTGSGILKSTDGGATWSAPTSGFPANTRVAALLIDPTTSGVVYAGAGFPNAGVYKSNDGGITWVAAKTGLPTQSVTGLAFDPANSSNLYTVTESSGNGGIFKSTNGGGSWTPLLRTDFDLSSVAVDRANPSVFYIGTGGAATNSGYGVYKSTDGGLKWTLVGLARTIVTSVAIDPKNAANVYATTTGGSDGAIVTLDASGRLLTSTYLGGTGADSLSGIAFTTDGSAAVSGTTNSADLPKAGGASAKENPERSLEVNAPPTEQTTVPKRDDSDVVSAKLRDVLQTPPTKCPDCKVVPEKLPDGVVGYFYGPIYSHLVCPVSSYRTLYFVRGNTPPGVASFDYGPVDPNSVPFLGIPTAKGTYDFTVEFTLTLADGTMCKYSRPYEVTIFDLGPLKLNPTTTPTLEPLLSVNLTGVITGSGSPVFYLGGTNGVQTARLGAGNLIDFRPPIAVKGLNGVAPGLINTPSGLKVGLAAATDNGVVLFLLQPDGSLARQTTLEPSKAFFKVQIGDFNADNNPDILGLGNNSTVFLADNLGGYTLSNVPEEDFYDIVFDVGIGFDVADLNNDGKLDVVLANAPSGTATAGKVSIYTGDGTGAFKLFRTLQPSNLPNFTPGAITVGQFDATGPRNDIAIVDRQNGQLYVIFSADINRSQKAAVEPGQAQLSSADSKSASGPDGFHAVKVFPVGKNPSALAIGDFNNDGKADVAVANSGSNDVSLLLGDGQGGFAPAVNFPVGNNPVSIAVGDVNGDGKDDIIVANKDSKSITILTNATNIPDSALVSNYFAQFGDGQGISSTITLVNPSINQTAYGRAKVFDSNGNPLSVDTIQNGQFFFGIPPRGVRFFPTDGQGNLVVGTVQVKSGYPIAGTILFSGAGLGVAGVPAVTPLTSFVIPVESDSARGVRTGVALSSPSVTKFDVTLRLHDTTGALVPNGSITATLLANGQLVKFIEELYAGKGIDFSKFRGTLEVMSQQPANGMAIRVSPGQLATLPVTGAGSKQLLFAQIGEANGISSTMTFVNPSADKPALVTVKMFDDNGAPLTLNLNGVDQTGQFSFTLAPMASASFSTPGTSATAKIGSVVVNSTENIGGTIIFGGAFGLAGVDTSQPLSSFIAPVEQKTQGAVTVGLALMNLTNGQITVKLTLRDENGNPVAGGTVDVALSAQGHAAKFIGQFFPNLNLADFRGTITGETTGQIAVTEIRQSGSPLEFATLPVAQIIP